MSRLVAALVAALLGVAVVTGIGSTAIRDDGSSHGPRAELVSRGTLGAASGGDPYFPVDGNSGYDVRHYRIENRYRPATDRLRGVTVLRARAHEELASFNLDLALTPDQVSVNGHRVPFRKPSTHELRIVPAHPLPGGKGFEVRVSYHGKPSGVRAAGLVPGEDLYFHAHGETVAVGEPQIGPWWFAANETPRDKATYDIVLRVPEGRQAVSNGELVRRHSDAGWTTWHWRMSQPMVTYLAFFAAGHYRLEHGTADGRPFVYAVSRDLSDGDQRRSMRLLRTTPEVVDWLQSRFGSYPFTSIGGVAIGVPTGFALENQSRPVYDYAGGLGDYGTGLLVHEEAHQWFGDDVSLRRWRDVWLNEGFATYAEWLYDEDHGRTSVAEHLREAYSSHGAQSGFWKIRVDDPGPGSLWTQPVYVRGAMTLAALRQRIGDDAMDTLLRQWVDDRHFGHGTTTGFRRLAATLSAEQLDAFFSHWLSETTKPGDTAENGLG